MIVTCPECRARFDDAYRWTFCPHETFAANDGLNNFAHHPEAHLSPPDADERTTHPNQQTASIQPQKESS